MIDVILLLIVLVQVLQVWVGVELFVSGWIEIDQLCVDGFVDVIGDY